MQPEVITRRDVSDDSGIHEMTEEKRRSAKRIEFIIKELIQTEKAYVDDLKCCIDVNINLFSSIIWKPVSLFSLQVIWLISTIKANAHFLKFMKSCRYRDFSLFQTWKNENKHRFVFVFSKFETG